LIIIHTGLDQISHMLINLPIRDDMLFYLHACMCILVINHKLIAINYTDHVLKTGKKLAQLYSGPKSI